MKSITQTHRTSLDKKLADFRLAQSQAVISGRRMVEAENTLVDTEVARSVIQDVSYALQQEAHQCISAVVSRCLDTVFDAPYEMMVGFERKRGKTEAILKFKRESLVLEDPTNEAGNGQVDVAAFALRLACLVMQRPPLRRLLVLDEPFKCIRGKQYRDRMRGLLQTLAKEMGVQMVLCVDHEAYPQFMMGSVVEVG